MKTLTLSFVIVCCLTGAIFSQSSDAALRLVVEQDRSSRSASGELLNLNAAEHLSRGKAYFDNRHFPEAREHFQKIITVFPSDAAIAGAVFMTGRSYMWEREYAKAYEWLSRTARDYPALKEGREALAFKGASAVRMGKHLDAASAYEMYTVMYPTGEKIESAYLNLIDAYREAAKYSEADAWIEKSRTRFSGMPTETNALHARLRMEIFRGRWNEAERAADAVLTNGNFAGSMTSADEVRFLKAFALEKAGRKQAAMDAYAAITNSFTSYYGGLAAQRLAKNGAKFALPSPLTARQIAESPAPHRTELLAAARKHKIDPRFILSIMKQESAFRAGAKSPSAARGLLQLVFDTAIKLNKKAGIVVLEPDDLYKPSVNIALGSQYINDLGDEFNGMLEAVAASYNGGEDNAARWLNRSQPREPFIFASEVGFAETKQYVFKVMNNYRIYRELYDENLNRR